MTSTGFGQRAGENTVSAPRHRTPIQADNVMTKASDGWDDQAIDMIKSIGINAGIFVAIAGTVLMILNPNVSVPGEANAISKAKNYVMNCMRDPGSVMFSSISVDAYMSEYSGQRYMVTGQFNAKNGFGGYVGWKNFTVHTSSTSTTGGSGCTFY